jgi:histidyl-tRNA synthetase
VIGAAEPTADVELLVMADQLLKELGIADGVTLQLNTLGDGESREAWRAALIDYFRAHKDALSEDRRTALSATRCASSIQGPARQALHRRCAEDRRLSVERGAGFLGKVTGGLDAAGVSWVRAPALVRGLDYYRHTAFEFVTDRLGAQGTVLGGGRYDGLMESLGGAPTPAVGWAAGIERLAMLVADAGQVSEDRTEVTVVVEDDRALTVGMGHVAALRRGGWPPS